MLVSLLELRAEVYEREEDIENSVLCLMRAESCSKRSMGQYSLETVRVMLELQRVLIKCGTRRMKAATERLPSWAMCWIKWRRSKKSSG